MSFFLSPDVVTNESDQTLYAVEKSNKIAGIAGGFQWGPVDVPTLITGGEKELVSKFGIPDNDTYPYVMPAIDFLSYSSSMWLVRQVGPTAVNAVTGQTTGVLVKNDDAYLEANLAGIGFVAKYPGSAGNALAVSIVDSAGFANWEFNSSFSYRPKAGEYAIAVVDTTGYWTGAGAVKQVERLIVNGSATTGGSLTIFGATIEGILISDTSAQIAAKIAADSDFTTLFDSVSVSGSTITYTAKTFGKQVARVAPAGALGLTFTTAVVTNGNLGTIIEKYELVKDDSTAKNFDGTTAYWVDAINQGSNYIRVGDKTVGLTVGTTPLVGGVDDYTINLTEGFGQLVNAEAYDVQFLICPGVTVEEQRALIDVANTRLDVNAFVAPPMAAVVNNKGNELADVQDWRLNTLNEDSTYAVAVDNWGYIYDRYNDVYRWIPATGGTAGVAARSFDQNDPWISFAGHARGVYKNYKKMAWSATKAQRDVLYPLGVNSIVTFPGEGIVLYGDKTLTERPTAFGHVNVRWAFIVAKKSLADLAKYYLFEVNDDITRAQFVNAARPLLRNMKSRRAFEDFQLICDATNNDADVRMANKMGVQVYLKPTYSINWVVLDLTAVRPDVVFTETE